MFSKNSLGDINTSGGNVSRVILSRSDGNIDQRGDDKDKANDQVNDSGRTGSEGCVAIKILVGQTGPGHVRGDQRDGSTGQKGAFGVKSQQDQDNSNNHENNVDNSGGSTNAASREVFERADGEVSRTSVKGDGGEDQHVHPDVFSFVVIFDPVDTPRVEKINDHDNLEQQEEEAENHGNVGISFERFVLDEETANKDDHNQKNLEHPDFFIENSGAAVSQQEHQQNQDM